MDKKLPDHRALEKMTSDLGRLMENKKFKTIEDANKYLNEIIDKGEIPEIPSKDALQVAQDLMYDAWDSDDRKKRIDLAQKALSVSADCADAYVLLAEETSRTLEEAKALYQKGVEAGERALGKKTFEKDVGHFWGIIETRPYMRARRGLAQCLWELGNYDEAIEHYREMLELNPGDNQGIRYILAACLAELERYDELEKLLKTDDYKDDWAPDWLYTKALLFFVKGGSSKKANKQLATAMKDNPYVPEYLAGKKALPKILPGMITDGGEDEAISYADAFLTAWQKVPGAIDWLKEQAGIKIYPKVGRNEPCPCGSGKKYKKCCGK